MPTGQIRWLCDSHSKENHVKVMGSETSMHNQHRPLVSKADYNMLNALPKYKHLLEQHKPNNRDQLLQGLSISMIRKLFLSKNYLPFPAEIVP